jgi:hypothetical protein
MNWKEYVQTLLTTTLLCAALLYGWILFVDPYGVVWFSPPFEREPVSRNQRFSYPAIARNPAYDSLIVGTSSVRLLNPAELNPLLDASFANLAMNAATPYEQSQILSLFVRHHPLVRYAFLGIDDHYWCELGKVSRRFTHRPFPDWMYDENRWNDLLYLFNSSTAEQAWRQFRNFLGLRQPKFGIDGYTVFVPPESEYDIDRVMQELYPDTQPGIVPAVDPPYRPTPEDLAQWVFPTVSILGEMLGMIPPATPKVLILPPYHQHRLPVPGTRRDAIYSACKAEVVRTASRFPNTLVLDFMIRSPVTLDDASYWDPEHYRVGVASIIVESIVDAMTNGLDDGPIYRVLARTSAPGTHDEHALASGSEPGTAFSGGVADGASGSAQAP